MQGAYTDPISHQMAPFERTHTALEQQQIRQKENHKYSYIWRPVRPIGCFHDFAYYINNGWKEQEIIVTCIYVLQPSIPVFQRAVLKKAWRIGSEMAPHPKLQPSYPVIPPPLSQTVVTAVISREVIKLSSGPLIVCIHWLRVTSINCIILWWVYLK